jgi:nucleoside phosphorylase
LSRFDAFSDAGAALAGEDACRAIVGYLFQRGRGQRIAPARMAADLGLEEQLVQELVALATSPAVGLLQPAWQIRCPRCEERIDREALVTSEERDGEARCPECDEPIAHPAGLPVETRYRLAADADAEVAAGQRVEQAKPDMRAVVLCALLVELRAVRAQMQAYGAVGQRTVAGGEIYLTGALAGEHVTWEVFAACTERSNPAAAASLANAINNFSPQLALYVGIAGGITGKVALGDVVAATTVVDYDQGKETPAAYEPRELQLHSSFDLTQTALHIAASENWRGQIDRGESDPDARFAVHIEPIAAGGKVIAASGSPTAQLIEQIAPRAVAVETEGAGFLATVRRFQSVSGIVVRGISDMRDGKQASDAQGSQKMAAARAAAFAFALLDRFQPPAN